ncbi:MAG: citrate lyase subunit alpha [Clostridia bacterium]|nr:citrate lyase subunit alpha [Clostridia bacterium]
MNKIVSSLREAIRLTGLKDGMTVSFHHHLRNGDKVLNLVMAEIASLGIKDLTVNASALLDVHEPLIGHMRSGVVTGMETSYMSKTVGDAVCAGVLREPVLFHSHGERADAIMKGRSRVDVAFIAASAADDMGNATGRVGPSAFGALSYPVADALRADKVIILTDTLMPYPLSHPSIEETCVDYVVQVDEIGDPAGVASGTARITGDPVALYIARLAAEVMDAAGIIREGMTFQTGAGGASLAAAMYLHRKMKERQIRGRAAIGGITGYLSEMLKEGYFEKILDTQCFDLGAIRSLRDDPNHLEINAIRYASPGVRSAAVDNLDVVILGATQIDTDFNVNVHTTSDGRIMGGSGGHTDCAAGAKVSMILSPLVRQRLPMVVDRVACVSTPGDTVDVFVSQYGVAVNPRRKDLAELLAARGLPLLSMEEQKREAEKICGVPRQIERRGRTVANVLDRSGKILDRIFEIPS